MHVRHDLQEIVPDVLVSLYGNMEIGNLKYDHRLGALALRHTRLLPGWCECNICLPWRYTCRSH